MFVYFAIFMIALLGFCGLVVDTGRMELRQNQLQAAADAGALAGAGELWHGGSGSNYQTAAKNDVAAYETANNIASTGTPATQLGASYGPYVGDYSTVQVIVTQSFPTTILGLLSHANSSITLTARAVAQVPPCMIFFGAPTVSGTYDFYLSSAGADTTGGSSCPLYARDGVVIDGFSHYRTSQVRSSGSAGSSSSTGSSTYPAVYSVPVIPDPLSYITPPSAGSCVNSSPISDLNQSSSTTINLTPGTYCGSSSTLPTFTPGPGVACGQAASRITPAIDIEGKWIVCPTNTTNGGNCTSVVTVNLSPGLYIMIGGFNFTCTTVNGTGVTIYSTNSQTVGYGLMHMTSTTWNVSAPTTASNGGIAGITLMNDPAWAGGTQDCTIPYSTWYGDGVVYLHNTGIYGWELNMSGPNYMNIVAPNMYVFGNEVRPSVNYINLPAGNPLHTVVTLVQ